MRNIWQSGVITIGTVAALFAIKPADASIVELTMSSAVSGTTHTTVHPWLDTGDIATLTIRYDTETASSGAFGGSTLYKNAITYFGFALERGGVQIYGGSASGNFGQIDVADDAGASSDHDRITFRIFDDNVDYPSGTRTGTVPAPALSPKVSTGDPVYGDLSFMDFRLHFETIDNTVLTSEALPTVADLDVGGGSPFAVRLGTTPWSGAWRFDNSTTVLGGFGTFGAGTNRATTPVALTTSVSEFNVDTGSGGPGNGSGTTRVPEPDTLGLLACGLLGIAARQRRGRLVA